MMHPSTRELAESVKGFMPAEEGMALFDAGCMAGEALAGAPFVEIGSWCAKSTLYLGSAALERETVVFAVDHHRGSEENQAGWEHHDPDLVDSATGRIDTLPTFRSTIEAAGLEDVVIAVVGDSRTVARHLDPHGLALVFIDGGHGPEPAHGDYEAWAPRLDPGGLLVVHDVFPDPADGGRPPFEIYRRALDDGFTELNATGSLRVLRR